MRWRWRRSSKATVLCPRRRPTPADVASDVTFEVDPNIVAKAKTELATTKSDLPLMVNDYVAAYINFSPTPSAGTNTLLHSFERAPLQGDDPTRHGRRRRAPGFDLPCSCGVRLSAASAQWQVRRRRHVAIHAPWQLRLARNAYVDERFDPEKSTRAYARYMKFIYDQLGDWYLSMAGYDWARAMCNARCRRPATRTSGKLYRRNNLPAETKNYVPQILAAIIIANHPTQYGFDESDARSSRAH